MTADNEDRITISFQVPLELHERAVKHAAKTARSLAGLSRWALMAYLNSEEAQQEADGK